MTHVIKTEALTKYYGKTKGIENLNLTVEEGDFFGFIGPNGAGKSTTIRMLLGLLRPGRGKAEIFGQDIEQNRTDILRDIGYLPSEVSFYNGMRVKDILKLSASLRKENCAKEAETLCERLKLDPNRKLQELSLGNRKKTAIVCALQHKPRLCILDEPTSGLDPLIQREFFSILKERNQAGTTIFLSSHVLSEIQRNCNRAAIVRVGDLIACDCVEKLTRTKARRVTIHTEDTVPDLEGIHSRQPLDGGVSFLYEGSMDELIFGLQKIHLADLTITEPDLEEIFMHYYTEEAM